MRTAGRYSVAFIATAVAVAVSIGLSALIVPMRLFFFWVAVFVTAVVAGLGPSLLVVVLAVLATAYLRFEPVGSFAVRSGADLLRLLLFASFATAISVVASMRRRAEERARQSEARYRSLIEATPIP